MIRESDSIKNFVKEKSDNKLKSKDFFFKQDDSIEKPFLKPKLVDKGCRNPIEIRFDTLICKNCDKPWDWYKNLGYDKAFGSRVRRGLQIPKKEDRIKIANYFKTDSSTIWTAKEIISAEMEEKNG